MTTFRARAATYTERTVHTSHPGWIGSYYAVAALCALGALMNAIVGDWGDVLDGLVIAIPWFALAGSRRDVNALMGGHR